jgi:hypothetical protein
VSPCASKVCAGVACYTPPPDACDGAGKAVHYALPGTCSEGACKYPSIGEPCAFGCSAGACLAGP